MRITLNLDSTQTELFLPFHYHEYLQAAIYNSLTPVHAQKLHQEGFVFEKRQFRLFTFSRLLGRRKSGGRHGISNGLVFIPPLKWTISSPVDWLVQEIVNCILISGEISVGNQKLLLKSVYVHQPPHWSPPVRIRMLSPMTIYSTLNKADGRKLTHYYAPQEADFSILMSGNLRKKFELIYHRRIEGGIEIRPLSKRNRERIIKYKGTVIKAWDGLYELDGMPELIRVAYECGLGGKNSQGFGMWEVVERAGKQESQNFPAHRKKL